MFLALYGEKVNIGESVFISLFSMLVVFVVLLIISYMIDLVAVVIKKARKQTTNDIVREDVYISKVENKTSDDTVTVIAAAIAAYLGTDVKNLKIKKIRRINNLGRRI